MIFLRSFNRTFETAVEYYLAADKSVARRFIDAVDHAQKQIVRFPKIGKFLKSYRALSLTGFPYSFCYSETLEGEPVAIVLYHHKQKEPPKV